MRRCLIFEGRAHAFAEKKAKKESEAGGGGEPARLLNNSQGAGLWESSSGLVDAGNIHVELEPLARLQVLAGIQAIPAGDVFHGNVRSEERRVGKECRCRRV